MAEAMVNVQPTSTAWIAGKITVVAPAPARHRKMLFDAVMDADRVGYKSTKSVWIALNMACEVNPTKIIDERSCSLGCVFQILTEKVHA